MIPQELTRLNQWVLTAHDSKLPLNARNGYPASSTCPATWSSYEEAVRLYPKYDLGFVFNNNGIVGIDIDAGYTDDGRLSDLATEIIGTCLSYTEHSRSGRGFHILVKGSLPFKGKNNLKGVEIYQSSRYFIVTGKTIEGLETIKENQGAIDYILSTYFEKEVREAKDGRRSERIYSPQWVMPEAHRVRIRPTYPTIEKGCRNLSLASLAGRMRNTGYDTDLIAEELLRVNSEACEPPLPEDEVMSIAESIARYRRL